MAELRLEQLQERDRLYDILNQDYEYTYFGKDHRGIYPTPITYTRPNRVTPYGKALRPNEVLDGVANNPKEILQRINHLESEIGKNILPDEWHTATHPDSRMIGYDAIHADLKARFRGLHEWAYPHVPEGKPYANTRRHQYYKHKDEIKIAQAEIDYLKLVYLETHSPKQLEITATFKEKLQEAELKASLELQSLQAQLGVHQQALESEILESEATKLDIQESHLGLLSFNKLIDKIEELHEPEQSGFNLEGIGAKTLLAIGLGLIGVVILLIVVKK